MNKMELPPAASIFLALTCAVGSAIFSGLTLGLLTLNCVQLKMLIDQPDKSREELKLARYAKRIMTIRKDGNYLLVTLLISNVAVNSAFTIILGSLVSEYVALILSITVITLFGEVVPQAVCARYGLIIGGWFTPPVWVLEWILFPIVKPISYVLNVALGEEIGSIYSRNQLKALVRHHHLEAHVITKDEARILHGGLDVGSKTVSEIMTPIENVFGLDIEGRLNDAKAAAVLKAGYSRIPVFDFSKAQCTIGLVFVRDLVLLNPASEIPVTTILSLIGRNLYTVDSDTKLLAVLAEFKKGHTHLAVVRRVVTDTDLDPYYEHIGIVTLEDIIEEILQDEIYDEYEADQPVSVKGFDSRNLSKSGYSSSLMGRAAIHQSAIDEANPDSSTVLPIAEFQTNNAREIRSVDYGEETDKSDDILFPLETLSDDEKGTMFRSPPIESRNPRLRRLLLGHYHSLRPQTRSAFVKGQPLQEDIRTHLCSRDIDSEAPVGEEYEGQMPDPYAAQVLGRLRLEDRRRGMGPLDSAEASTVACFLSSKSVALGKLPPKKLQAFLVMQKIVSLRAATVLYSPTTAATFATLLLQGNVTVKCGSENFESTCGPWSCLCMKLLTMDEREETVAPFYPDYRAIVSEDSTRVLTISKSKFLSYFADTDPALEAASLTPKIN